MRELLRFNQDWLYLEHFEEAFIEPTFNDSDFANVILPHTNKEIPYNYFDENMYQFVSCYRKHFTVSKASKNKRVFLDFEGVMTYAKCYLNGNYIGEHKGGYTPFSLEITDTLILDSDNVLVVLVDSTEREDIPPFGYTIDYLCYGGIYRDVQLRIVDASFIDYVFVKPSNILNAGKSLSTRITLNTTSESSQSAELRIALKNSNNTIIATKKESFELNPTSLSLMIDLDNLTDIKLWDLESPNLYYIETELLIDGSLIDTCVERFGFRTAEFTTKGFFLNGKKVQLIGLNRHQSFPYVGYAMPKRAQIKDADILKDELGLNLVRTSHYPQAKSFINRCDEIGLLVFEEIPGWQHLGNKAWQDIAINNVKEMINRDYNNASIIMWGVRVNESADDHDFYQTTNQLAHELDDIRQTGGVRCITNSELLEDVYTMNDFILHKTNIPLRSQQEVTGLDYNVPYLVTENNGHMYPTKRFDHEERLVEHALRHMYVQNAAAEDDYISGAIGWCAFDYNTHCDFGSGDRICYHGVTDMFRIPKFAAYGFKSQLSPNKEAVLEPATLWTIGERCGGGIVPLTIFTNCDKVELYIGDSLNGTYYPDKERYPGLQHPPITITETITAWGRSWDDAKFIGYVNDAAVITKSFSKNPILTTLSATADDCVLSSNDWDTTRIVYRLLDQEGNLLPYINDSVELEIEGPATIIGPSKPTLIGGCIAVWIKTTGVKGTVKLTSKCSRVAGNEVTITVE